MREPPSASGVPTRTILPERHFPPRAVSAGAFSASSGRTPSGTAGRARRTVFSASSGRTAPPWPATAAARVFSASSGRATPSSRQAGRLLRARGQRGPVRGPGCSPWPPSVRGPRRRRLSKSVAKAWISPGRRRRNVDIPRFCSRPIPTRGAFVADLDKPPPRTVPGVPPAPPRSHGSRGPRGRHRRSGLRAGPSGRRCRCRGRPARPLGAAAIAGSPPESSD